MLEKSQRAFPRMEVKRQVAKPVPKIAEEQEHRDDGCCTEQQQAKRKDQQPFAGTGEAAPQATKSHDQHRKAAGPPANLALMIDPHSDFHDAPPFAYLKVRKPSALNMPRSPIHHRRMYLDHPET